MDPQINHTGACHFGALRREQPTVPEKMGWKSCPEEKILSQTSMLSGTGEMIDVIGDDISHYEGEEDGETHQGDNNAQGDSIRMDGGDRVEECTPPWYL